MKGIIIPAGIGLPAAARALGQGGSLGKIKLTGLAPATLIKIHPERLGAGHLAEREGFGLPDVLRRAGTRAVQAHRQGGETFKAGRLGDYAVSAKGEVVLGPAQIVTPANVDQFKF